MDLGVRGVRRCRSGGNVVLFVQNTGQGRQGQEVIEIWGVPG